MDQYFRIEASYEDGEFKITIKSKKSESDTKYIEYSYTNSSSYNDNEWKELGTISGKDDDGNFVTNHSAIFKIKDSEKHNKIYFRAYYSIANGIAKSKNVFTLEYGNNNKIESEKDKILRGSNKISFGYYTDKTNKRWYISSATSSEKVNVYSLMPIKNSNAGWGIVGKNVAKVDLDADTITIDNIPDNIDGKYNIRYGSSIETIKSNRVQYDIEKIRNSTIKVKWWFFSVDKKWYIINKDGHLYRFESKEVVDNNGNKSEEYNWQKIDLEGAVPIFSVENGVKKFIF